MNKQIGDMVQILIGPHKGKSGKVINIEYEKGASSGWFTIEMPDGRTLLLAGNEITL